MRQAILVVLPDGLPDTGPALVERVVAQGVRRLRYNGAPLEVDVSLIGWPPEESARG